MSVLSRILRQDGVPSMSAQEVNEKLKRGEACAILDVREAEEWEAGHIPGAKWIPLGELPERFRELPKEQEIICVCRSGNRSALAAKLLAAQGYRVHNLQRGMLDWPGEVECG